MCLAVPGQILTIAGDEPLARTGRVSFAGVIKEVSLAYVPEAQIGDYVLVHVGVALQTVDAAEAAKTLEYFRQIEELGQATAGPEAPDA